MIYFIEYVIYFLCAHVSHKKMRHFIAGPCSIESEEQALETAEFVRRNGATAYRAMLFKPRSNPDSFQGLGSRGLPIIEKLSAILPLVIEVMDTQQIELVRDYASFFQVGARNCQNFSLLKELAKEKKPVIFKRGMAVTISEWIAASDYLKSCDVIFCERGIRTFETETRFTFDINAIPVMKSKGFTIIADPSHGTGIHEYVQPIAMAALAAGADGLMIEVHPCPDKALSDPKQQLNFNDFENLAKAIRSNHEAL